MSGTRIARIRHLIALYEALPGHIKVYQSLLQNNPIGIIASQLAIASSCLAQVSHERG